MVDRGTPLRHVQLAHSDGVDVVVTDLEQHAVEVGDRRQHLRYVSVGHDEARLGEHLLERLEEQGVRRALQLPPVGRALPLQQLEDAMLVAVRRFHVGLDEPVRVRGKPCHREEDLSLELERHEVVVFVGAGRRLRQHGAHPRRHLVHRGECCLRGLDAGGVFLGRHAGRRARRRPFPRA